MSSIASQSRADEFSLSEEEFQFVCKLVYESTGIVLDERKREMVYRRLMRRLRDTRLPTFSSYCERLKHDEQELPAFINSITTNLTSFFRENHHFDYLKSQIIPEILQSNTDQKLRIWSAACSTGEEPYSIGISLLEAMKGKVPVWDAKILATDLDSECIEKAKSGVYKAERISGLQGDRQKRWFMKAKSATTDNVRVKSEVMSLITFKTLNLLHDWPMKKRFNVIFCRNVLIYFDRPTQADLIARYHSLLTEGGYLMLGHSESLPTGYDGFEVVGRTIFRKI